MKPEGTIHIVKQDVNREIELLREIQYLLSEKMEFETKIQREIAMLHLIQTERRNVRM